MIYVFDLDDTLLVHHKFSDRNGNLDYNNIKPSPRLIRLLQRANNMNRKCYIFTNANLNHVNTCVTKMGIKNLFSGIVHRDNILKNYSVLKPDPLAYKTVQYMIGYHDPDVIFFDDRIENLQMADKFDWITVLINPNNNNLRGGGSGSDLEFPTIEYAMDFFSNI